MAQGHLVTPGSEGQNDFSDVRLTSPDYAEVSPMQLPIRGEKRIIPSYVPIESTQGEVNAGIAAGGQDPNDRSTLIDYDSFVISAALDPLVDYISVRLPHRGFLNGQADPNRSGVYRFLINPSSVQVTRTTVDAQSMTRAGWQFGVWGEDVVAVTLSGKTAGQYFSLGLTDLFQEFTKSYRNLQQLVMVYENNGYWFEGEEAGEGPLASDFTRRRIKMHQDVELVCGNFLWSGMFDSLTISQDAETPFLANFTLSFIAWKERFRPDSPYLDSIHNNVERGHSYGVYQSYGQQPTQQQSLPPANTPGNPAAAPFFNGQGPLLAAATRADQEAANFVSTDTGARDQTPTADIFNPSASLLFGRS